MDLYKLNKQQKEVVLDTEGKKLVVSCPGSGKTTCITYQIAHLIENENVEPSEILAVTFTRKAANEMKTRINHLIETDISDLWIGTFHSVCVKLLTRYFKVPFFSIIDEEEQTRIIKTILERYPTVSTEASTVIHYISEAKDLLLEPSEILATNKKIKFPSKLIPVYEEYQKTLKNNNVKDFDDLIFETIKLLKNDTEISKQLPHLFKYVICDEGQDSSYSNYELINLLSSAHNNLMIVADHDQSIYGWRGAKPEILLHFSESKDTKYFNLGANYRCSNNIVAASNQVIEKNTNRLKKLSWTDNQDGNLICYYEAWDNQDEAQYIADVIEYTVRNQDYKYEDFTILYRINSLSNDIERAFINNMLPYELVSGTTFFKKSVIKDIIAYLRLLINDKDFIALSRMINVPKRGVGKTSNTKIFTYLTDKGLTLQDIPDIIGSIPRMSAKSKEEVKDLIGIINKHKFKASTDKNVGKFISEYLIELGYWKYLEDSEEMEAKVAQAYELIELIKNQQEDSDIITTISEFIQYVSLITDVDVMTDTNTIKLMTVHAAKGLENKIIFIIGMTEGCFPFVKASRSEEGMKEERRLFYVAMTRAKNALFLSGPKKRFQFSKTEKTTASRFIYEIPKELLQRL